MRVTDELIEALAVHEFQHRGVTEFFYLWDNLPEAGKELWRNDARRTLDYLLPVILPFIEEAP